MTFFAVVGFVGMAFLAVLTLFGLVKGGLRLIARLRIKNIPGPFSWPRYILDGEDPETLRPGVRRHCMPCTYAIMRDADGRFPTKKGNWAGLTETRLYADKATAERECPAGCRVVEVKAG